ncbi:MAG: ABC transporter ATP-binding protein [Phycisphaerales bacterium]
MTQATTGYGAGSMTAAGDSVVICQQLTRVFKDFWMRDRARAVSNLSFEIRPREVFGLLGPNGSGKSTTIKMILGLLRPSSGRVAVFGRSPSDVAIKKRIGYLPEESYLYGFLNARETLEYYAKLFELDHRTRERRMDELLDMVGLSGAQFRPVREYSKGMQRRIGIAQALINDPDFLILDEPTTGLDPIGTRQIKDLIIELGRRGKTVLLSSHLLADVEDCVDRLVILYGGQKRAEGTCAELLESRSKTTIETDTLDESTLAEVDKLIRLRSGGERGVSRVSRPRQSLEELFLDIVDKAKAEQLGTSGAMSGGQTAAFLKGEAPAGEQLIDSLVKAADAPPVAAEVPLVPGEVPPAQKSKIDDLVRAGEQDAGGPRNDVVDKLMGRAAEPPAPAAPAKPSAPPAGVDESMIASLLGNDKGADGGTNDAPPRS